MAGPLPPGVELGQHWPQQPEGEHSTILGRQTLRGQGEIALARTGNGGGVF